MLRVTFQENSANFALLYRKIQRSHPLTKIVYLSIDNKYPSKAANHLGNAPGVFHI